MSGKGSHVRHQRDGEINAGCELCLSELEAAVGAERAREIILEAARLDSAVERAMQSVDIEAINNFLATSDEAQWFLAIENLYAWARPKVWLRMIAADFMAEAHVVKKGGKRKIQVTATGKTIQECLEQLASNVAAILYPTQEAAP